MAHAQFPHVFQPLDLRHKTLKNRINFGAHTANMSALGLPSDQHLGYYRERAMGGTAMIVVEPIPTDGHAVLTRGNFRHSSDDVIPGFRRITDACHEYDTVMIHQLYHVGQHGDYMNSYMPYPSPSGLASYHDASGSMTMSGTDIDSAIEGFVQAARRAQESGFDGVELFAAYHALIDQFWTPWSNRREDKWGGSFENRMRFSTELIGRIRDQVGEDFIIGMAVSMDPSIAVSLSVSEMQEIAHYHDERGLIDYITCGTGSYFDFYKLIPPSLYESPLGPPFAAALTEAVTHARVQAESHIRTPENANMVIGDGMADMVSLVRAQIADPHLVNKAQHGAVEQIRPCISCNQMCWARRHRDYWISCLVNPSAGREWTWGGDRFDTAATSRTVLVVGGGPAGLEAARVSAERGHDVTLVEAKSEVGGIWRLAGTQPSREVVLDHIAWYASELSRLGVTVHLGQEIDFEEIDRLAPEVVLIATGAATSRTGFQRARPQHDVLPGSIGHALAVEDVLDGVDVGQRVLIVDDLNDWRGTGTAVLLAERGHTVSVATSAPTLAGGLAAAAVDKPLRDRFGRAGGEALVNTVVESWSSGTASLFDSFRGTKTPRVFDSLVVVSHGDPRRDLVDRLAMTGIETHAIGDCVAARDGAMAIYEGRNVARSL
jgi:2,4-dienoyl-CoA reductase-like NADH-dependent reductase (Old Yellow Enzyme family)